MRIESRLVVPSLKTVRSMNEGVRVKMLKMTKFLLRGTTEKP